MSAHLWGKELATADGGTLHVANKFEKRYVLYAPANGQRVNACRRNRSSPTVTDYGKYLRD